MRNWVEVAEGNGGGEKDKTWERRWGEKGRRCEKKEKGRRRGKEGKKM